MGLKKYMVVTNGRESAVLLSDEDARRYGDAATPLEDKPVVADDTKAREPANKAGRASAK